MGPVMLLFFQLEDGHTLFDYDVGLNDIIQLLVRPVLTPVTNAAAVNGVQNGTANQKGTSDHNASIQNGTSDQNRSVQNGTSDQNESGTGDQNGSVQNGTGSDNEEDMVSV